jgi:hypothetical protein
VFILHLDNGVRVVARVPYRIAGPRRLTMNSEVATMSYSMYETPQELMNRRLILLSTLIHKNTRTRGSGLERR